MVNPVLVRRYSWKSFPLLISTRNPALTRITDDICILQEKLFLFYCSWGNFKMYRMQQHLCYSCKNKQLQTDACKTSVLMSYVI